MGLDPLERINLLVELGQSITEGARGVQLLHLHQRQAHPPLQLRSRLPMEAPLMLIQSHLLKVGLCGMELAV